MTLDKLLGQKKNAIITQWTQHVLETYPADSRRFLSTQKNHFSNPVGTTLSDSIRSLFEVFLEDRRSDRLAPILDSIIRIRAVQDFTPSQALAFLFHLKRIIRSQCGAEMQAQGSPEEWQRLESAIDDLALLGFEVYMKCREKLFEIRSNEAKNQVSRLLQKAGLICEFRNGEPVSTEADRLK